MPLFCPDVILNVFRVSLNEEPLPHLVEQVQPVVLQETEDCEHAGALLGDRIHLWIQGISSAAVLPNLSPDKRCQVSHKKVACPDPQQYTCNEDNARQIFVWHARQNLRQVSQNVAQIM